ncbi:YybH family protein [Ulvibacterium sp.]|uniref:YybH family protein n=1 Tax=Ulvibacterium sp. TaxID=2665914 RepID=UPI003BAA925B
MKSLLVLAFILTQVSCQHQVSEKEDIAAIRTLLETQAKSWSNHNIEGFMEGYLKSDSIAYFGSSGMRYGHQAMLDSYKERYPTKAHTGTLNFTLHDISRISDDAYWVMGEYHLTREVGDANGTFMIVLKRINGEWKIIGDSSC